MSQSCRLIAVGDRRWTSAAASGDHRPTCPFPPFTKHVPCRLSVYSFVRPSHFFPNQPGNETNARRRDCCTRYLNVCIIVAIYAWYAPCPCDCANVHSTHLVINCIFVSSTLKLKHHRISRVCTTRNRNYRDRPSTFQQISCRFTFRTLFSRLKIFFVSFRILREILEQVQRIVHSARMERMGRPDHELQILQLFHKYEREKNQTRFRLPKGKAGQRRKKPT